MSGADDQRGARPTLNEEAKADGLGYVETFTRNEPTRVEVFDGAHQFGKGNLLVEVIAELGEHPADLVRRALAESRRVRLDRLRAELADLRAAGDALADAAAETSGWSGLPSALWAPLAEARDAWRSVRGDAPTQPPADAWVSGSSGEPYGPGTVVDVIADEINTTFGMDLSWPKISGTAHRAAARLRREGHLDGDAHPLATRPTFADYTAPDDEADTLTAEQYRHIYDDLIRGLATDLGLDPDKAGGGSITAAVRRLVAGVSVPQKSTESPAGARCEHGVPVTRWCAGCTLTEQPPDGDR